MRSDSAAVRLALVNDFIGASLFRRRGGVFQRQREGAAAAQRDNLADDAEGDFLGVRCAKI